MQYTGKTVGDSSCLTPTAPGPNVPAGVLHVHTQTPAVDSKEAKVVTRPSNRTDDEPPQTNGFSHHTVCTPAAHIVEAKAMMHHSKRFDDESFN